MSRALLSLLSSGDRPFLVRDDDEVTHHEFAGRVEERLQQLGDLSDTQMVLRPEWKVETLVDLFAVPTAGAQAVIIDPGLDAERTGELLSTARPATDREAALIVFTSGTTGPPKPVRITTRNLLAAVDASISHLAMGTDDVWAGSLPLHHIGGLMVLYRMAGAGGAIRLPGRDRYTLLQGVTLASVVPTMLRRLLDTDFDLGRLRAVLVGGGPIPEGMLAQAHARGIPALPTYGMTETCAQVATLRPGSPPVHAADPMPRVEIRISDEGRIMVRGAQISPGYADQRDREEGEWFVTPDRGHFEEGRLVVKGRVDDVIVTGGENVNPATVEAVLRDHPEVDEAVVVGAPDRKWGEMVVAAYRGAVSPEELETHARTSLSGHQVPKRWLQLEEIPLMGPGKPDRAAVRELFR